MGLLWSAFSRIWCASDDHWCLSASITFEQYHACHVRGLSAMSPRVKTSEKRFIAPRNVCVDGPRQPPFKGGGKPGAGVRPPALNEKKRLIYLQKRGVSHRRQVFSLPLKRGCRGPPTYMLRCMTKRFFEARPRGAIADVP